MGCIMSSVDKIENGKSTISNMNHDQDSSKVSQINDSPLEMLKEDSLVANDKKLNVLDDKVLKNDEESVNVSYKLIY